MSSEGETLAYIAGDEAPSPGERIGPYELLETLGEGGMGIVYLAQQEQPIRRQVALKIIKLGMDSREVIARFEAERQALAMLSHPNIASVLDAGTTAGGRPYFVMEHVPGIPITDYCDQHRLGARERLELFTKVCEAVHHAHQRGLIHRDIKPSNILVAKIDDRPTPKIIDFGIAKATEKPLTAKTLFTQEGLMIGTPAYMSPEQAEGGLDIDTTTDIYSLGVVLYELLSGMLPFEPKRLRQAGYAEMQRIIREEDPDKPSTKISGLGDTATGVAECRHTDPATLRRQLRGDLDWIILKSLEKDRERRYRAATELAEDIQRHLTHQPVAAGPPGLGYRARKLVRRHTGLVISVLAVFLAVLAGGVVSTIQYFRAEAARQVSRRQLVDLQVTNGMYRVDEGDLLSSLPFLARALALEERPGQLESHRLRIASVLDQSPSLIHLWSHDGPLTATTLSADGQYVATASEDGTARVWRFSSGELIGEPFTHDGEIWHVGFSGDGGLLATAGSDGMARIWDVSSGALIATLLGHEGDVYHASFSSDSRFIATASADGSARVWEIETGKPVSPPLKHDDEVWTVRFSPDDRYVVTASADATGRVWSSTSGEPLGEPLQHVSNLFTARFSPDGQVVATASTDGTAKLWDMAAPGEPLQMLWTDYPIYSVIFSPDGTKVVTVGLDYLARVWDVASGQQLTSPMEHQGPVWHASFGPHGRRLVTGSDDGFARVWDTATGELAAPPLPHAGKLVSVQMDSSGRFVLTGSVDQGARVWDLATAARQVPLMQHPTMVYSTSLSRDGQRVVTGGSGRNYAQVWSARTGEPITPRLGHKGQLWSTAFSPDGRHVAVADEGGAARIWSASTGEPVTQVMQHPKPLLAVAFSPDGSRVATGGGDLGTEPSRPSTEDGESRDDSRGLAQVWASASGQAVTPLIHLDLPVGHLEFSPDGSRFLTAGHPWLEEGEIRIWDASTGEALAPTPPHEGKVSHASFSPDGRRISVSNHNGSVRIWDARSGKPSTPVMRHTGVVFTAFSPTGDRLLTAGTDSTARVWDVATGAALVPQLKHNGAIWRASFSPDGKWIGTASGDGTARVWDARTGQPVTPHLQHDTKVQGVFFLPDGDRVLTSSWNEAALWDLPRDARSAEGLELRAELLAGRRLSDTGSLSRIDSASLRSAWETLQSKAPQEFAVRESTTRSWSWREAEALRRDRLWSDALVHLGSLESTGFPDWLRQEARGEVLAELGRLQEAETAFAEAVDERPDQPELWFYLEMSRLGQGDQEGLDEACAESLDRVSGTQNPDRAYWAARICVLAAHLEDPALIRDLAKQRHEVESLYSDGYSILGAALVRLGQHQNAVERLQEALDARRGWKGPREWLWMGLAQWHLGQEREAEQWRLKAVERLSCADSEGQASQADCWMPWYRRLEATHLLQRLESEMG